MNAVYIMQDKNIHLAKTIDFNDTFWQHKIILIDSRNLLFPDKSIFIAFEGRFSDGHQFIDHLYHQGVRHFIISKSIAYDAYPKAHFIRVKNAVTILQDFARHHRQQWRLFGPMPVVLLLPCRYVNLGWQIMQPLAWWLIAALCLFL